jgi:hypothetical protein
MKQDGLWQESALNSDYAEVCSALYECELNALAQSSPSNVQAMQARLKSLPHYIKQAAQSMVLADSPLSLDLQNATWSASQTAKLPLSGQSQHEISKWYQTSKLTLALVVPVLVNKNQVSQIMLDTVDKLDDDGLRLRTNRFGWFELTPDAKVDNQCHLLKPTKRVMAAACAGHRWRANSKLTPGRLSLRELLLSCTINWRDFKRLITPASH